MNTFSFSRLNLYETCPKKFYYRYVLKLPEPQTKPLALGKAVHKAIELLIKGESFEEAIKQGMIECDFHEEVTYEEVQDLVRKAPKLKGETEKHFCLSLFNSP